VDVKMKILPAICRNQRGQAVIEFALVLPLLLLLVFGVTEFGRAWMTKNVITSAAREGCRVAVVTDPDATAVNNRVNLVCAAGRVTPGAVTVVGPDPADPERIVTVTVQTDFQVIPGNILGTFSGTIPLTATAIMRHESF
jgi:Flp pilus assembly protein TadG